MNCEKFERVVSDIARGQLTQAGLREEAALHTEACKVCAERLAQEQTLSVALRALALLDEKRKADRQVEANLLAAFRNRTTSDSMPAAVDSRQPATTARNRRIYWWAAAAALLLMAITLFALRVQNNTPIPQPQAQDHIIQPSTPESQNPQNNIKKQNDRVAAQKNTPVGGYQPAGDGRRRNLIHQTKGLTARLAKNQPQENRAGSDGKAAEEITTNFIRLYNIPMTEGGQLVRVQLPRSALSTFGLPVNAALADKPIKADVVIGNDGIARAIRFVQ